MSEFDLSSRFSPKPSQAVARSPRRRLRPTLRTLQACTALLLFAAAWNPALGQVAGSIVVYPENSSLESTSTRQFSAYVPISPNTIVWLINDVPGGNATLGTISATGHYKPPAVIPAANVVTIKARSTAFPASFGTAALTITRKYPWLWGASPSKFPVGAYKVTFNGSNFASDSVATADGTDVKTTYISSTKLIVEGMAMAPGTIKFAVRQPAPGAVTGNAVTAQVTSAAISVALSPTATTVALGETRSFTATVTGSANTAVTWSVNGIVGGNMAIGFISTSGMYTAPMVMPASSTMTIRATAAGDPAAFGQATVTVSAPPPPISVSVSPASATVPLGTAQPFTAMVAGSVNQSVTWSVNGIPGGASSVGTINASGVFTAPSVMPSSSSVTLRATSMANTSAFAQAIVTFTPAPPTASVVVIPGSAAVQLGQTRSFSATVTGAADGSVTWSVNGIAGGSPTVGTINASGLFTAPATMPASSSVHIRANSTADPSAFGQAAVTLLLAPPATVPLAAARFLEQSSFGPSPATVARFQQLGMAAYLEEQLNLPETVIPTPGGNSLGALRQWMLYNYSTAPDQLRQRVAYALSQILVTSGNKLNYADEMLPWLKLLSKHAFGNYRDLLREVTISPSMGKFLDLANSVKPGPSGGANENYPRELLQLLTIGLWRLNPDGSQMLDAAGKPVPAYTQDTVQQVALALTGWTYATAPGAAPRDQNWEYFGAPMETRPQNHAATAKHFLGCSVPAGLSVDQDLDALLDCLMSHPNIAPFIATRLIRSLVLSNPSGGYIQRVAAVFENNGAGVRGDLKAVITAILTDPEARQDVASANQGRLKEPVLQLCGLLRALQGRFNSGQQLTYLFDHMAQSILSPPSVFSWFSPLYRVPKSPLFGPEFQIYTPTEAVLRGNFIYMVLTSNGGDTTIDLSPFQAFANDMPGLVETANQVLLYGRMPAGMKQAIIDAASPGYDATARITTVLYLTALSGHYAVQH